MSTKSRVTLYPWDPESSAHRHWLYKQRVECTWDQEKVETKWREQQIKGEKCLYWIIVEQLQDTAVSLNAVPRNPSQQAFVPIGHISLDSKNPEAAHLGLRIPSDAVYWIKTFFVQHHLQSKGIGRAAMDEVEAMAVNEPLSAKTLMLDTVEKGDQLREEFAKATYGGIPKVTNQDWYSRRGYQPIDIVQNYYDVRDRHGKRWDTKTIFMRKDIC
ncbi:hypothetical protein N7509_001806 [Penicillium cosmopolitanum]|uniref:N-acetyltransferase domain-containing protein n=1 Tax=Penicillium cosmopolitanum TaxID=1131564 RepID=A0A9X0BCQ6_9EURO|nr:uncharacterized protein N7509_001806 [Penicillium cosmopolitanum]KAJ5407923.1 hypothetical protein N7509_001806 [Penicillium cosmopolitanum]